MRCLKRGGEVHPQGRRGTQRKGEEEVCGKWADGTGRDGAVGQHQ
jgi:hypothetical protein